MSQPDLVPVYRIFGLGRCDERLTGFRGFLEAGASSESPTLILFGRCSRLWIERYGTLRGMVIVAHTISRFMENYMRHAVKNAIRENMHGLLECIFVDYANLLRANYPGRTIRNAAVFVSGVPEFARLGFIELVDAGTRIPEGIPDFVVRTIKRTKHQPIWIPGPNFPASPDDIYDQMKPFMRGNEVVWRHIPSQRRNARRGCRQLKQ